ncbi:transcriptional regulator, TetR family [Enhydrobacter aerosaccus]|uniref:Transcriptional regulator, TetR family n=1 Tax=Enhydrobacter aerosaccus TaxID=225324 RepID=A0A1T4R445_9HYPH|nr:TetR/AcrR family transcriptional regulator [Enhydrobacter aerosaccus]SKA10647.1 transcriptional regulator, TetR family [Enhydrobacter aerosaccus]
MRTVDPIKHEQKRQEILAAAIRCALRSGLKGTSTSDICAEAKISPGHLYHYFENKDAIFAGLAETKLNELTERLRRNIEAGGATLEAISAAVRAASEASWHRDEYALVFEMLAEAVRSPAMASLLRKTGDAMRAVLANAFREGQKNGEFDKTLDPALASAAVLGMIDAAKAFALRYPETSRAERAAFLDLLMARLLAPGSCPAAKAAPRHVAVAKRKVRAS